MASIAPSPVEIQCKGVLFDMDGILISSIASVERSWTKWAEMREAELRVIEEIELADGDGLTVLPGVLELLAALPAHRWNVVTRATERLARIRLEQAGVPVPPRLITAESVTQGKPDPAPYRAGAALLGLAPEDCVVFEDAAPGARAGRAAGCIVIATTFSHPAESLKAAHYLVEDVTGVAARANGE